MQPYLFLSFRLSLRFANFEKHKISETYFCHPHDILGIVYEGKYSMKNNNWEYLAVFCLMLNFRT